MDSDYDMRAIILANALSFHCYLLFEFFNISLNVKIIESGISNLVFYL